MCEKTSKLSYVKKLFVIGLVPDIQENYQNARDMMEELSLEDIEYGLSADINIYLCLCGK